MECIVTNITHEYTKMKDNKYKITKEELIRHCEKQINQYLAALEIGNACGIFVGDKRYEEHVIFLRLLQGESVDDIFNPQTKNNEEECI